MDPQLVKFINSDAPQINPDLANGLATVHMAHVCEYIDKVIRSAAIGFPQGMTYDGFRVYDPYEEYRACIKPRNKKRRTKIPGAKSAGGRQYETAQTDFFMVEYGFSYNGEKLQKRPLYLPFVGDGGSITISDTKWYISPVLADRVISIGVYQIFVRLLRDRLTFGRDQYACKKNGVREAGDLVNSRIYHKSKDKDNQTSNNAKTSMVHYLFCKYGFKGAMQKYANATPLTAYEFPEEQYPRSEWDIYETLGMAPKSLNTRRRNVNYVAPSVKVAIRKSENNDEVRAMILGFFYIADHFPTLVDPRYVDTPGGWIGAMGYMLFSENYNRGKIEEAIQKHLSSLDDYADPIVIDNMRAIGIHIENIYDFFAIIAKDFGAWISNHQDKVNSMYDKELSVLYFVLFDITKAIFNLFFALKANSKKVPTKNDVEKALSDCLKQGLIYGLSKSHGEITSISYSGDNKAFKATATLTPQTSTTKMGKKGSDRGAGNDPSKRLHPSVAEVGAVSAMTKADPTGRSRINHYMMLNETKDLIVRNPKFAGLLDMIAANELTTRSVSGE